MSNDRVLVNCRDCEEEVLWLKTRKGKNILVQKTEVALQYKKGQKVYDKTVDGLECHWDTCPKRG